MLKAIGIIELNSIAIAVKIADYMVKAGEVELIFSKPVCPGKYIIMVAGDVGAVEASVKEGTKNSGVFLLENIIIPNISDEVIKAIYGLTPIKNFNAIGIMEFFNIITSIKAADFAVKASQVDIIDIRLGVGIGGKSFVILSGEVSAVEEGIVAGCEESITQGTLINKVVIPSPSKEVFLNLL